MNVGVRGERESREGVGVPSNLAVGFGTRGGPEERFASRNGRRESDGDAGTGRWERAVGVVQIRHARARGRGVGTAWPRGAWEAGMIWKTVGAINAGAQ